MKKIRNGIFVCLEGADGCGKSTQVNLLKDYYASEGFDVTVTREPGGILTAEQIRNVILYNEMDNLTEAFLFMAARRINYTKVVTPALNRDQLVICDRFIDSTIVYQSIIGNIPKSTIMILNNIAIDRQNPDLSIILDIDPKVAFDRVNSNPDRADKNKYDAKPLSFFERLAEAYGSLEEKEWAQGSSYKRAHVDANGSREDVLNSIVKEINKIIRPRVYDSSL